MKPNPSNSLIVLNSDLITKVISELGKDNFTFIINLIEELHPADTAVEPWPDPAGVYGPRRRSCCPRPVDRP